MRIIKPRRIKPRGQDPVAILDSKYSGEVSDFEYAMDVTKYIYPQPRIMPGGKASNDLDAPSETPKSFLSLSGAEAFGLCLFLMISLLFLI